jgi:hypothetical protein
MKKMHILLGCLLYFLTVGIECSAVQEKYYLEKNIDEVITQLIQSGYDEQQILALCEQHIFDTAEIGTGGVLAIVGCIVGAGTILCIAGTIAGGMWWYHNIQNRSQKNDQDTEMEEVV